MGACALHGATGGNGVRGPPSPRHHGGAAGRRRRGHPFRREAGAPVRRRGARLDHVHVGHDGQAQSRAAGLAAPHGIRRRVQHRAQRERRRVVAGGASAVPHRRASGARAQLHEPQPVRALCTLRREAPPGGRGASPRDARVGGGQDAAGPAGRRRARGAARLPVHPSGWRRLELQDLGTRAFGKGARLRQLRHDRDLQPDCPCAGHTRFRRRLAPASRLSGAHRGSQRGRLRAPWRARSRRFRGLPERPRRVHGGRLLPHGRHGGFGKRAALPQRAHLRHVRFGRRERVPGRDRRQAHAPSRRGGRPRVRRGRSHLGPPSGGVRRARRGRTGGFDAPVPVRCSRARKPGAAGVQAVSAPAGFRGGRVAARGHRQGGPGGRWSASTKSASK